MIRKKIMRHDKCGGEVSRKTHECWLCKRVPDGNNVTLVRLKLKRPAGDYDDVKFKTSLVLRGFKYFRP